MNNKEYITMTFIKVLFYDGWRTLYSSKWNVTKMILKLTTELTFTYVEINKINSLT